MKTAIFSLIIAVSVAILSVFQFNKYQKFTLDTQMNFKKLEDEINLKLDSSTKEIALLKEQTYTLSNQIQDPSWKNTLTNLQKLQNEVTLKIEGFNKVINTLQEQEHAVLNRIQNPAWKLAEVEYLLYLASARLEGDPNIKAARELLITAEEKVKSFNDPNFAPLSQALTQDLEALKNISPPNTEELWYKVDTLIQETVNLSPRGKIVNEEKKEVVPNSIPKQNLSAWKQAFLKSLQEIKDLIKIRQYAKPIEPLLSSTQQTLLTTNLRLLLEQIRFAILTKEQTIYQNAIHNTEQLLTTYYSESDPKVKNLQTALNELNQINLRPAIPKITSLEFFKTTR